MRSFKEQLEKDFSQTFFNPAEFGEIHTINGDEILIVVDNETLLELNLGKTSDTDGIFRDDKMFFVQKKDLGFEPVVGQIIELDGESYPVGQMLEDYGGYTIILRGNAD